MRPRAIYVGVRNLSPRRSLGKIRRCRTRHKELGRELTNSPGQTRRESLLYLRKRQVIALQRNVAKGHQATFLSLRTTSVLPPQSRHRPAPLRRQRGQIFNPAFASPSAIRRTPSSLLNGCRAKCSVKEYFGLISMSSFQIRRASSPSPR